MIPCSFVIETNDTKNLKEPISCHCCTNNWSGKGSVCCPQLCYWFPSCPQNTRNNAQTQESKELFWTVIFPHFWNLGPAFSISMTTHFIQYVIGNEEFQCLSWTWNIYIISRQSWLTYNYTVFPVAALIGGSLFQIFHFLLHNPHLFHYQHNYHLMQSCYLHQN